MTTDKLNPAEAIPCPFCGSADISDGEVLTAWGNSGAATQSMCNECFALGPQAKLLKGEIDYGDIKSTTAWNRRADISATDAQGVQQWQPIETAPKDGTKCLFFRMHEGGQIQTAWWKRGIMNEYGFGGDGWSYANTKFPPTHWMPLPPPPSLHTEPPAAVQGEGL